LTRSSAAFGYLAKKKDHPVVFPYDATKESYWAMGGELSHILLRWDSYT
jgi:hypothetical protein